MTSLSLSSCTKFHQAANEASISSMWVDIFVTPSSAQPPFHGIRPLVSAEYSWPSPQIKP